MVLKQIKAWGIKGVLSAIKRFPSEYRIKRFLKKNVRKYRDTVQIRGITIVAPVSGSFSLSKTVRDFIVCLHHAGVPCQVFDIHNSGPKARKEDYFSLITPIDEFNLLKYTHVVEMFNSPIPSRLPIKRCRIAFWEGEFGILSVFPYLSNSDIVIAMSDFNAEYFKKAFSPPVKVSKITYPLLPLPQNILDKQAARKRFGISRNDFVVFYNFDIRADYRKNSTGTLEAFAMAFKGRAECRLLLKVNGMRSDKEKAANLGAKIKEFGIDKQVIIISEYLTQLDIYSLSNSCDVYLSLHRAEGFGLGIAEAMSLGKAVVVTDYSATSEFCHEDTAVLVPYKKVSTKGDALWSHMKICAEPDVGFAASAMYKLYKDREVCVKIGKRAQEFIKSHYSVSSFQESVNAFLGL